VTLRQSSSIEEKSAGPYFIFTAGHPSPHGEEKRTYRKVTSTLGPAGRLAGRSVRITHYPDIELVHVGSNGQTIAVANSPHHQPNAHPAGARNGPSGSIAAPLPRHPRPQEARHHFRRNRRLFALLRQQPHLRCPERRSGDRNPSRSLALPPEEFRSRPGTS
jgi:hypothetical protein